MHALQVYDVVLDAALHTQKCGPRNLLVTGEWEWLLNGFAGDCLQQPHCDPQPQTSASFPKQSVTLYLLASYTQLAFRAQTHMPFVMSVMCACQKLYQSFTVLAAVLNQSCLVCDLQLLNTRQHTSLVDAADFYGIRQTYTVLAHLRWAIKQENATVTAECLEILSSELKPLKEAEANGGLLPQVLTLSHTHPAACTCTNKAAACLRKHC